MRILACADMHGHPERVARVRTLVAEHAPDIVLLPGDLTHLDAGADALTLLHTLPLPVLAVWGNMDGPRSVGEIKQHGKLMGAQPVIISNVTFGGPNVTESCDVLVTHEPPLGTLDVARLGRHIGSRAVLEMVQRLLPRVLTCGHVHESPGIVRLGDTLVVNCTMGDGKTGGALIELTPDGLQARLL
jgi:Icc-related predicted phosphoesterase